MTRLLFCVFLLWPQWCLFAQRKGIWGVQAEYHFGRILAHNSSFQPRPTAFTHGFELSAVKQTNGNYAPHRLLNFPELGFAFVMMRHGDQRAFGNMYALKGFTNFYMLRSRYVSLRTHLGSGIAVSPTRYHPVNNPDNTVIGSVLNGFFHIKLGLEVQPFNGFFITADAVLTHYSNANVQRPNLGINMPGFSVGAKYFPNYDRLRFSRARVEKPALRHELMAKFTMGVHEHIGYRGPKYPVYLGTVGYSFFTSAINKISAGFCSEYDVAIREFYELQEIETKYRPAVLPLKASVWLGDEILVGRVGMLFQVGAYVFNAVEWQKSPLYAKIGTNIYFGFFGKEQRHRPFVVSNFKTHYFVAQYLEAGAGYAVGF